MNARKTSLFLALVSLGAVIFLAVTDLRRSSPGPLSAVHGSLERLSGRSGCAECHGGLLTSMTAACRDCHDEIAVQLDGRYGLHGALEPALAERCALCHGEHLGPGFASVNMQSFRNAGFESADKFDHARIGFEMSGKHLEIGCADCHTNAAKAVLAEGERRFLGLRRDCTSCHADVHKGEMHVTCVACHGQAKWNELASVGHERFLPLVGGHAGVSCRKCHEKDGERALEREGAPGRPLAPRACEECHESLHAPAFVDAVAKAEKLPRAQVCVRCHAEDQTSFRDPALASLRPQQHALSGFHLGAPHAEVACEKCHDPKLTDFARRYPGRGQDECAACHADPHGGQFANGPFSRGGCLECHERVRFEPNTFDLAKHAHSALPLEGAHAKGKCEDCHVKLADAPRRFRGTPDTCSACHDDAHAGYFGMRLAGLPLVAHGDCARCHTAESFTAVADFDHSEWTGFPVVGAHAQEQCAVCHVTRSAPDAHGRSFGTVEEHFGRFTGCVTCHADVHEGLFDAARLAQRVDGREGCARCHGASSFRALPWGFDHAQWTGFVLAGGHASTDCSSCHAQLRTPTATGRTWGAARGPGCADCHPDPHAGQFVVGDANDCARCHSAEKPAFLVFDHEKDARFRLGDAHSKLACSACHATVDLPEGGQAVRYRPLPVECVDCHGVREDVLMRRKRGGR
ncbi:MAG: hypothetical protein IPJ19_14745 [Planctomycetes bacterium]|nr:hypothetical protein [Planctomycetota bacterium]